MEYIKRLRDLREDHDLTQAQVAEILGTSQTMVARYERGAGGAKAAAVRARRCRSRKGAASAA